jgi:hypothetical protein
MPAFGMATDQLQQLAATQAPELFRCEVLVGITRSNSQPRGADRHTGPDPAVPSSCSASPPPQTAGCPLPRHTRPFGQICLSWPSPGHLFGMGRITGLCAARASAERARGAANGPRMEGTATDPKAGDQGGPGHLIQLLFPTACAHPTAANWPIVLDSSIGRS